MKEHPLATKQAIAMFCVTTLSAIALLKGIDGALLALAFAAIAGIAGYSLKTYLPGGIMTLFHKPQSKP